MSLGIYDRLNFIRMCLNESARGEWILLPQPLLDDLEEVADVGRLRQISPCILICALIHHLIKGEGGHRSGAVDRI